MLVDDTSIPRRLQTEPGLPRSTRARAPLDPPVEGQVMDLDAALGRVRHFVAKRARCMSLADG